MSWASAEKIHTAKTQRLSSSSYAPPRNVPYGIREASTKLGEIVLNGVTGRPIGGGSATFGAVVEFDDELIVVSSEEEQARIEGPVTRWRLYPRSMNYENHLHVIFDDRIEILAFYRDYFVDQDKKRFGTKYRTGRWRG